MAASSGERLVVAISSRALFNLDECHAIYERDGVDAYTQHQIAHEDEPLEPGVAFPLVRKLLALNENCPEQPVIEVILLSRNSADTGLWVFNSIRHYELPITRAAFTRGASTSPYVGSFGAHLFLSTNPEDVRTALDSGHAAATVLASNSTDNTTDQLRIAFDGDAVLFSDDSERIFKTQGLVAFEENETAAARIPLAGGPFKPLLAVVHQIQRSNSDLIRTALVTARGAPAHERVVRTLRTWGIRIDEAFFLGGLEKGSFLRAFGADIFFDDQQANCESARQHVATGHVPNGVANSSIGELLPIGRAGKPAT